MIFGPPCSGKTTFARIFEKKGLGKHIAIGSLTRWHKKNRTELGQRMIELDGKSVYPPDLLGNVLSKEMHKYLAGGFIIDGFPKHLDEAKAFMDILLTNRLDGIICLVLREKEITDRGASRFICGDCDQIFRKNIFNKCSCGGLLVRRKEDQKEILLKRLADFSAYTLPAVEFLKKNLDCKYFEIDSLNIDFEVFIDSLFKQK